MIMKNTMNKLEEAKARGFVDGVIFVSATGVPDCVIMGSLKIKNYKPSNESLSQDEKIELSMNGDIVSTGGYGLIYDASTDTWGQPLDLMLYTTSKNRTNAKVVKSVSKAMDDYFDNL